MNSSGDLRATLGELAARTEEAERRIMDAAEARLAALQVGQDSHPAVTERATLLEVIERARCTLASACPSASAPQTMRPTVPEHAPASGKWLIQSAPATRSIRLKIRLPASVSRSQAAEGRP